MNASSTFDLPHRRLEVGDVALQLRLALVGHRSGADACGAAASRRGRGVEFGERQRLARTGPGAAVRRVGVELEAAEPLVDIGDEARLGVFAVVDDVDAELDLLSTISLTAPGSRAP